MKNPCIHFGCLPIEPRTLCINTDTQEPEPFINALHLLSDEIYQSEVDVMIRSKASKRIVGRLGKVSELKVGRGQPWFRIDSTEAETDVINYIKYLIASALPFANNKPYFVSEHINFMQPKISIFVSRSEISGVNCDVVSWVDLEV